MTREDYESLLASPGWEAFKGFLLERRRDLMEALAGDHVVTQDREKTIRECIIYKELANLTWAQVAKFYNIPETPEAKEKAA